MKGWIILRLWQCQLHQLYTECSQNVITGFYRSIQNIFMTVTRNLNKGGAYKHTDFCMIMYMINIIMWLRGKYVKSCTRCYTDILFIVQRKLFACKVLQNYYYKARIIIHAKTTNICMGETSIAINLLSRNHRVFHF